MGNSSFLIINLCFSKLWRVSMAMYFVAWDVKWHIVRTWIIAKIHNKNLAIGKLELLHWITEGVHLFLIKYAVYAESWIEASSKMSMDIIYLRTRIPRESSLSTWKVCHFLQLEGDTVSQPVLLHLRAICNVGSAEFGSKWLHQCVEKELQVSLSVRAL